MITESRRLDKEKPGTARLTPWKSVFWNTWATYNKSVRVTLPQRKRKQKREFGVKFSQLTNQKGDQNRPIRTAEMTKRLGFLEWPVHVLTVGIEIPGVPRLHKRPPTLLGQLELAGELTAKRLLRELTEAKIGKDLVWTATGHIAL